MEAETQHIEERKGKRKVVIPALLVLLILLVPAAVWIGRPLPEKPKPGPAQAPIPRLTIERNPVMNFDPFLIPLGVRSKYTLISLSFSLELPNGQIREEMEKRIGEVRGFIYDTLKEDFFGAEGIPSVQAVKDGIGRAVGKALPDGRVVDVYISQFLAL